MELKWLPGEFAVCCIPDMSGVTFSTGNVFVLKNDQELSLVCETAHIPPGATAVEPGFCGLKVSGILDFGLIGVIAGLSKVLADEGIPIFVISTYHTDILFIKAYHREKAQEALLRSGYTIS